MQCSRMPNRLTTVYAQEHHVLLHKAAPHNSRAISHQSKEAKKSRLRKAIIINIFAQVAETVDVLSNDDVIFIPYLVNSKNKENVFIDNTMITILNGVINEK